MNGILLENKLYLEDLAYISGLAVPWEKFKDSVIMISGATGMIGSMLIDALMYKNEHEELGCNIIALGRNAIKAGERFEKYIGNSHFEFFRCDINKPVIVDIGVPVDYIIHLASNTHPLAYASDPVGTITANVFGTYNLLEYAISHDTKRVAIVSSNEIYGENRGDTELFDECYLGYIDCNTMRAGYPESKRCAESLCQAYIRQHGLDIVIPRLTRSYGPTLLKTDTKALSQFLSKALDGEDIVLKSAGTQYYSYTYVADAVAGLLYVILKGECGEAYNVADVASDIQLKDLASQIAKAVDRKVVFDIPDETEAAGFSKATKARLDGSKIKSLGWEMKYDIKSGIKRTIEIMKTIREK